MNIKILTLNIEGDKHIPAIASLLRKEQPNIICFQEIFEQDFYQFQKTYQMHGLFQSTINVNQGGIPGYHARGNMGVAILSKFSGPLGGEYFFKRKSKSIPLYKGSPNSGHRMLLWQTIGFLGKQITISTTHFTWSAGGKTTALQRQQLSSLFRLLDKVKPNILCGDFNAPRGGEIYSALSKRYVDNIPLDIKSTIDPDLHYSHGKVALVVDGFFSTPGIIVKNIKLLGGVSDHLAIVGIVA